MEHRTHHAVHEHAEPSGEEAQTCHENAQDSLASGENKKTPWFRKGFLSTIDWKNALIGFSCAVLAMNIFSFFFTIDVSIQPKFKSISRGAGAQQTPADAQPAISEQELALAVIPQEGFEIPIRWGDTGVKLVESGALDMDKFKELYSDRGGIPAEAQALLTKKDIGTIRITPENSSVFLNILWAVGLGSKNAVLDKGPMNDPQNGGAAGFASTGGWILAKGDAMAHYSKHAYFSLTPEQQKRVEAVSQNIYRPCCGNSVYFPDCNHGMAMLGLLELMASQGMSEDDMYRVALQVNAYWFPDTYMTVAKYLKKRGVEWNAVNPKEILGDAFSSASGYRRILSEEQPVQQQGGGGCGV